MEIAGSGWSQIANATLLSNISGYVHKTGRSIITSCRISGENFKYKIWYKLSGPDKSFKVGYPMQPYFPTHPGLEFQVKWKPVKWFRVSLLAPSPPGAVLRSRVFFFRIRITWLDISFGSGLLGQNLETSYSPDIFFGSGSLGQNLVTSHSPDIFSDPDYLTGYFFRIRTTWLKFSLLKT